MALPGQLRSCKPSIDVLAPATSSTGPPPRAWAFISVAPSGARMRTPCGLTSGGSGVSGAMLLTRSRTSALPLLAATMNSASRSVPGPRSAALVTSTVSVPAACPAWRCCPVWYHHPSAASAPRSSSTPTAMTMRRLVRMWTACVCQDEHRVPGAPHQPTTERHIDRQRQRGDGGERGQSHGARQARQMRQQPGPERRGVDPTHGAHCQAALLKQPQIAGARAGAEDRAVAVAVSALGRGFEEEQCTLLVQMLRQALEGA